jgi:hypothetical protein
MMNERIKNLEVQCWDDVAPEWAENVHMVFNIEKFAELIVGECANMIEAAAENADDEDVHGMRNAAGLISRAFITFYNADLKNE